MKNKITAWVLGSFSAVAFSLGLLMLLPWEWLHITLGIIVICLSICVGMLTINPLCLYGLITGVCMMVVPHWVVAIVLLCIGISGSLSNLLGWKAQE